MIEKWINLILYWLFACFQDCFRITGNLLESGFCIKAKDVQFSKKRRHNAVNGNEKSATKEQCKTTENLIFLSKKVQYLAKGMQIMVKTLWAFTIAESFQYFTNSLFIFCKTKISAAFNFFPRLFFPGPDSQMLWSLHLHVIRYWHKCIVYFTDL